VKLCRRAGKRQDEVLLEEESPPPNAASPPSSAGGDRTAASNHTEDIDIVGEDNVAAKEDSLTAKEARLEVSPPTADRQTGRKPFNGAGGGVLYCYSTPAAILV
jgi:hypothetical protein